MPRPRPAPRGPASGPGAWRVGFSPAGSAAGLRDERCERETPAARHHLPLSTGARPPLLDPGVAPAFLPLIGRPVPWAPSGGVWVCRREQPVIGGSEVRRARDPTVGPLREGVDILAVPQPLRPGPAVDEILTTGVAKLRSRLPVLLSQMRELLSARKGPIRRYPAACFSHHASWPGHGADQGRRAARRHLLEDCEPPRRPPRARSPRSGLVATSSGSRPSISGGRDVPANRDGPP